MLLLVIAPVALAYAVLGVMRDGRRWLAIVAGAPALLMTVLAAYITITRYETILMGLMYLLFLL